MKHQSADAGSYKRHWHLRAPVNVNHGTAGATPVAILRRMAELDDEFNADRERFYRKGGLQRVDDARRRAASFFGADEQDFVFVDNATEGFVSVLKSLPLGSGDQVVITNHIYPNFLPVLREESMRRDFEIVTADVPFPVQHESDIIAAIEAVLSGQTKLVIVDHITSPTAIIFPVKRLIALCEEKGIDVLVDGAHAPGQIEVNLRDIGAAYYIGNHHKWICAPQVSGFLYVRKDRQADIMPAVGSACAGRDFDFVDRFSWTGSRDMAARLLVPETIDYMAGLHPDGWPGIMRRNHDMALNVAELFCQRLGRKPPCPKSMTGSMVSVPLGPLLFDEETEALGSHLRFDHILESRFGLNAQAVLFEGQYLLRLSCHLYNEMGDYQRLLDPVADIINQYKRFS